MLGRQRGAERGARRHMGPGDGQGEWKGRKRKKGDVGERGRKARDPSCKDEFPPQWIGGDACSRVFACERRKDDGGRGFVDVDLLVWMREGERRRGISDVGHVR